MKKRFIIARFDTSHLLMNVHATTTAEEALDMKQAWVERVRSIGHTIEVFFCDDIARKEYLDLEGQTNVLREQM